MLPSRYYRDQGYYVGHHDVPEQCLVRRFQKFFDVQHTKELVILVDDVEVHDHHLSLRQFGIVVLDLIGGPINQVLL